MNSLASRVRCLLAAAACGLLLLPVVVQGRVFRHAAGTAPVVPGTAAYRTTVEINGGKAEVAVIAPDRPLADPARWLRSICASFGKVLFLRSTDEYVVAGAASPDRVLRLLSIQLPNQENPLVVEAVQSVREQALSAVPPAQSMLAGIPTYPGATVQCHLRNADTRTAVETLSAAAAAEDVLRFYRTSLGEAGWAPVWPESRHGAPDTLLFSRGHDLCCVMARPDAPGECTVTVLQKLAAFP